MRNPRIADALYNMHPDSGASRDYAKGVIVGVYATLQACIFKNNTNIEFHIRENLPDKIMDGCLPEGWEWVVVGYLPAYGVWEKNK